MKALAPKLLALAAVCAASLAFAAPALAAPHFEGSFKVGGAGANNVKLVSGPDGNVWMTLEGSADDVARISPVGVVTEFDLPGVKEPGGITLGPENNLWVTQKSGVARFSAANPIGTTTTFAVSAAIEANASIVTGPDKQLWVATKELVLHFSPANPTGTKVDVPVAKLNPKDIDVAGQLLVVADSGNSRVVTVSTAGAVKDVAFVGNEATNTAQGVAGNPSGELAFSESDGKEGLARATPPGPAMTGKRAGDPFGVALGSDGAYYFAMSADDNVRRLTADGQTTAIEGFPKKFFPRQITSGPGNTLWVAMEIPGENVVEVARITGLEPPVTVMPTPAPPAPPTSPMPLPPPNIKLGKTPKKVVKTKSAKAAVSFTFSTTTPGASFECVLAHRVKPKHKGGKVRFLGPGFQGCRSPKSYRLKPGSYRFQVRSIIGTVTTPKYPAFHFKVVREKAG